MVTVVAWLLVLQGVLGAFDTFVNHEWREPFGVDELAGNEQSKPVASLTSLFRGDAAFRNEIRFALCGARFFEIRADRGAGAE